MNQDRLTQNPLTQWIGLAGAAVLASTLTALTVVFAIRRRRNRLPSAGETVEEIPVQPAVNISSPVAMPQHFSEDVLIPGKTFTGTEAHGGDDLTAMNPEGV